MKIEWSETARLTYAEELDFIYLKWGNKEVENFMNLSGRFLKTLSTGTFKGRLVRKGTLKMSVISKQTSVYYKVDPSNNKIGLISFWNNK
jgi:hypothetical protein|tara:strand:+ start:156 stop:425 length:270 start_codon:yes stop_codon:yes gene_type:complete